MWLREHYEASERRVCGLLSLAVSSFRSQSRRSDEDLRSRLMRLAREKPRFGYRRLHVLLERGGGVVNDKKLYRVYRESGLCLRRKKRKHCVRIARTGGPGSPGLWANLGLSYHCRSKAEPYRNRVGG